MNDLKEKTNSIRRAHILDAAIKVFAAKGFRAATIKDVAAEAGIADGTIYNYFANKTALLMGILNPQSDGVEAAAATMPSLSTDPVSFLADTFARSWSELNPKALDVLRIVFSEALINPELRAVYAEKTIGPAVNMDRPILRSFVKGGSMRAHDVDLSSRALIATVFGFVMLRLLGDEMTAERWDDFPAHLAKLFQGGLAT